ncbi:zinc finger BED domain-containing protein 4-like [Spodoptera litura]|uniref:Zinc finger BED domain-containing protein 4-like n=1 Tax=Spodoptera litura TaxID=69820 RepID=A0A9J7EPJ9_SPOLT|nr:zinc finger BED domain-containing protein 4-like [Spodoptera litura]
MLKRFVELENAIRATLVFTDSRLPIITTEDWTLYSQLCQILRPFEEITKSMSGEKYVSGSSVIVVTRCLKEACEKITSRTDLLSAVTDVALTLRSGLIDRFGIIEQSGTFSLCTFMDPRFKTQGFCDQNEANKTKVRVRKMVAALIAKTTNTTPSSVLTVTDDLNKSNDDLNPWNIFDQMIASTTTQGTPLSKAIKEVDMYLADELLPRKDQQGNLNSPLEWWKNRQFVYPHLKQIFVTHCNIVATSVPCERIFSKTGLIINQRRTRLTTSKVEQIMFLNINSPEDRFKGYE